MVFPIKLIETICSLNIERRPFIPLSKCLNYNINVVFIVVVRASLFSRIKTLIALFRAVFLTLSSDLWWQSGDSESFHFRF